MTAPGARDYPKREWDAQAPRALEGIRVLDLSRLVAGNMVTHVLADHGAEVIKVERPGVGDDLRAWKTEGVTTHFKVYCRNKKSVTLDLRKPSGKELLLRLAETARVLVENFKPGTLEEWGLGPEVLLARNPNLILVRVSGWGQDGPWRHKPGFGSLVEAMSGFAAMNGFDDRPPVLPPLALADMIAGLYGAFAAMVAIRNIELAGGGGQVIDLPLFDPILSVLGPLAANHRLTGTNPPRNGSRSNLTAPRNVYRCRDGKYVALSASMQSMAERFLKTIGQGHLIEDPRFATNSDRVKNNDILDPIVAAWMAERDRDEVLAICEAADVTVGPVADPEDLSEHPYVKAREVVVELPDSAMGSIPMHTIIPRLSETPGALRTPAPELGEHNDEIWGGLGLSADDIAARRAEGVI